MKILKINWSNPDPAKIYIAKDFLKKGYIIVYPTDTVYGIAANIYNENAILNVFKAKNRPMNKPLSICLSKIEDIKSVAHMDNKTEKIVQKLFPGPFTVILRKKNIISPNLTAGTDKIGIRIPDNQLSQDLASDFPITSTSANISGLDVPESPTEIIEQIGSSVDLILDAGICKYGHHSTVVDMTYEHPRIIREGAGYKTISEIIKSSEH